MMLSASSGDVARENFFAPQHPQIVVHAPFADELPLGGVPDGVVSL